MDKLSRLEHIIKRLASRNGTDGDAAAPGHPDKANSPQDSTKSLGEGKDSSHTPSREASEALGDNSSSLDVQFGRLVINDSMSYYVGNVLWANLANEVRPQRTVVITI